MVPQSRILTALARTRLQSGGVRQFGAVGRTYSTATGRRATSPTWDSPLKRITGTMMMFIPVTGVVMFWPVAVWPVMDWWAERS